MTIYKLKNIKKDGLDTTLLINNEHPLDAIAQMTKIINWISNTVCFNEKITIELKISIKD